MISNFIPTVSFRARIQSFYSLNLPFVLTIGIWALGILLVSGGSTPVQANPGDSCSSGSDCDTCESCFSNECYTVFGCCGNGACDGSETCSSCSSDCGACPSGGSLPPWAGGAFCTASSSVGGCNSGGCGANEKPTAITFSPAGCAPNVTECHLDASCCSGGGGCCCGSWQTGGCVGTNRIIFRDCEPPCGQQITNQFDATCSAGTSSCTAGSTRGCEVCLSAPGGGSQWTTQSYYCPPCGNECSTPVCNPGGGCGCSSAPAGSTCSGGECCGGTCSAGGCGAPAPAPACSVSNVTLGGCGVGTGVGACQRLVTTTYAGGCPPTTAVRTDNTCPGCTSCTPTVSYSGCGAPGCPPGERQRITTYTGGCSTVNDCVPDPTCTTGCTNRVFGGGNVNPASVQTNTYYTISCNYGGAASGCVYAVPGSGSCSFTSLVGTQYNFSCVAGGTPGTYGNQCQIAPCGAENNCPQTNGIATLDVTGPPASCTCPAFGTGACGGSDFLRACAPTEILYSRTCAGTAAGCGYESYCAEDASCIPAPPPAIPCTQSCDCPVNQTCQSGTCTNCGGALCSNACRYAGVAPGALTCSGDMKCILDPLDPLYCLCDLPYCATDDDCLFYSLGNCCISATHRCSGGPVVGAARAQCVGGTTSCSFNCGNGVCCTNAGENSGNCPADCPPPPPNAAPSCQKPANQIRSVPPFSYPVSAPVTVLCTDDGLPGGALTYTWQVQSGPAGWTIVGPGNSPTWTATFTTNGTYVLRVNASDGSLTSPWVTMNFVVNNAPTVNAGADPASPIPTGSSYTINDATVTDDGLPTGVLSTAWSQVSGPPLTAQFSSASVVKTTVTFISTGTYVLRLTASDGAAPAQSDTIQFNVATVGCNSGEICGRVLTRENQIPLANVIMELRSAMGDSLTSVRTDAGGSYVFPSLSGTQTYFVKPVVDRLQSSIPTHKSGTPGGSPVNFDVRGVPATVRVTATAGTFVLLTTATWTGAAPPVVGRNSTSLSFTGVTNWDGTIDVPVAAGYSYRLACWKTQEGPVPIYGGSSTGVLTPTTVLSPKETALGSCP